MDVELVRAIVGPVLTTLATGAGIAAKQGWESRDARQRAHRQLREATEEVKFIREWIAAQDAARGGESATRTLERAREDLQRIYGQVFVDSVRARVVFDRHSTWNFNRIFNAVLALRIRVDGAHPRDLLKLTPAATDPEEIRYRRPLGYPARAFRVVYWFSLPSGLLITMFSFANIHDPYYGGIASGLAVALVVSLLLAVLPSAFIRGLVLYLDHRAEERKYREQHSPNFDPSVSLTTPKAQRQPATFYSGMAPGAMPEQGRAPRTDDAQPKGL